MSTDPKKNDEVKDEALENVAGGAGFEASKTPDATEGETALPRYAPKGSVKETE